MGGKHQQHTTFDFLSIGRQFGHFTIPWALISFPIFYQPQHLFTMFDFRETSWTLETVVYDIRSTLTPPSAAGLAAFSVPHTSFSFSGTVTRFGPPLDASASRLLVASERIAACRWHLGQERPGS